MNLVWTLNFNLPNGGNKNRDLLIDFYRLSINSAKKLGYNTIIYTNQDCVSKFEDIVDEIVIVEQYENSPLFDSFKIKVLEERTDNYYLIDGDVILSSKLPIYDVDVTFDAYETKYWEVVYGEAINEIIQIGANDILPIFNPKVIKIMNCGLLRIKNETLRTKYVDYWKKFNYFIQDNYETLKVDQTSVGAQYILTKLCEEMGVSIKPISHIIGEQNEFYRHYAGNIKYKINKGMSNVKSLL